VAEATASLANGDLFARPSATATLTSKLTDNLVAADGHADQPWRIVREKEHPSSPMTVDDALFQMELVGHDFFLFLDKDSGRASVVYRRRGYDYGVISLAA
jgi:hypothetical protein